MNIKKTFLISIGILILISGFLITKPAKAAGDSLFENSLFHEPYLKITQSLNPEIISAQVSPEKVYPGEIMTVTTEIKDNLGIKSVTADMGGIEIIELKLIKGNSRNGSWQTKWLVHDTEVKSYITVIAATNILNKTSYQTLNWQDSPATKYCPNRFCQADSSCDGCNTGAQCTDGTPTCKYDSYDAEWGTCGSLDLTCTATCYERDSAESHCEATASGCGTATWDATEGKCCGDDGGSTDTWCSTGGSKDSCLSGTWYDNHCSDGTQNCDECMTDCGGTDCAGYCVEGYCCNSTCTEKCKGCNVPGYEGTCTVRPLNDNQECNQCYYCDGTNLTQQPVANGQEGKNCTDACYQCNGSGGCVAINNAEDTAGANTWSGACKYCSAGATYTATCAEETIGTSCSGTNICNGSGSCIAKTAEGSSCTVTGCSTCDPSTTCVFCASGYCLGNITCGTSVGISSVSDSPDPQSAGGIVTFNSAGSGTNIKLYVCSDSSCTNCGPLDTKGCWTVSENEVNSNPLATYHCPDCSHSAAQTKDYWGKVCNQWGSCTSIIAGSGDGKFTCNNIPECNVFGYAWSGNIGWVRYGGPVFETDGLVASWAMDEGSGDYISDSTENNNTGTIYGSSWVEAKDGEAKYGSGLSFDGKDNYIELQSAINDSKITATMWYYFDGTGGNWNTLFCRDGGTYHHLLIQDSTNEIGFYNSGWYSSGYSLTAGQWYHIVLIKDGTNSKIYINNDLKQNSDSSFNNADYPLKLIGNYSGHTQGSLGTIDEVRIYNRALTPGEITAHYNGYGVYLAQDTGEFSGYTWSENIGWLSFNREDTGAPPADPYSTGVDYIAIMATSSPYEVSGWMRALAASSTESGGWEGWVKLRNP